MIRRPSRTAGRSPARHSMLRVAALALALAAVPVWAGDVSPQPPLSETPSVPVPGPTRSGGEIYQAFRDGLADGQCDADAGGNRWKSQFAHVPGQLVRSDDDLLPLFGYVVDALREAGLPTEFALIPFVESGYRPGARNRSGPSGLWQFIGTTARNHGVPVRNDYDGRLSPVDSTQAAVRYLKTLHGMFGGDWRLTVMAYNAGEYRLLQAMRRAGVNSSNANPATLPGLPPITQAYVQKLHALACVFENAGKRQDWMARLDRQVPRLAVHEIATDTRTLDQWASHQGHDAAWLKRMNPALAGNLPRLDRPMRVLAPAMTDQPTVPTERVPLPVGETMTEAVATMDAPASAISDVPDASPRSHRVRRGESAWTIAYRYGIRPQQLLSRNGLKADAILRPGMLLKVDKPR